MEIHIVPELALYSVEPNGSIMTLLPLRELNGTTRATFDMQFAAGSKHYSYDAPYFEKCFKFAFNVGMPADVYKNLWTNMHHTLVDRAGRVSVPDTDLMREVLGGIVCRQDLSGLAGFIGDANVGSKAGGHFILDVICEHRWDAGLVYALGRQLEKYAPSEDEEFFRMLFSLSHALVKSNYVSGAVILVNMIQHNDQLMYQLSDILDDDIKCRGGITDVHRAAMDAFSSAQ